MSGFGTQMPIDMAEYDQIEAAFTETARGRRFLAEFARRQRGTDTDMLLQAIGRIENAVSTERGLDGIGRLRDDLMDMAGAIARTKAEIAALSTPETDQTRLNAASEALDAIVRATERATSDILGATEDMQEVAWTLRERGADETLCDELDRRATEIYTACSFQDLTAQRTGRVVHTLRYLEERIASMIAIWGPLDESPAPLTERSTLPKDAPPVTDLSQSDVDRFLEFEPPAPPVSTKPMPSIDAIFAVDDLAFVPAEPEPATAAPPKPAEHRTVKPEADAGAKDFSSAFADLDELSIEEKIALFS